MRSHTLKHCRDTSVLSCVSAPYWGQDRPQGLALGGSVCPGVSVCPEGCLFVLKGVCLPWGVSVCLGVSVCPGGCLSILGCVPALGEVCVPWGDLLRTWGLKSWLAGGPGGPLACTLEEQGPRRVPPPPRAQRGGWPPAWGQGVHLEEAEAGKAVPCLAHLRTKYF